MIILDFRLQNRTERMNAEELTGQSVMQQIGYAVQFDETLQISRQVGESQRTASFKRRALPCQQCGNGGRVDRRQLRQIDFRLPGLYRPQTRFECAFGIIDSQRKRGPEHVGSFHHDGCFTPLAVLAASFLFLSDSALIKPSMPPLLISLEKLPL